MIFTILLLYFIIINIIAVVVTIYDKIAAIYHKWRVRESTLFLLSTLGGSVGMYITMQIIRHKTKHLSFMIGIPAIMAVQLILTIIIWSLLHG